VRSEVWHVFLLCFSVWYWFHFVSGSQRPEFTDRIAQVATEKYHYCEPLNWELQRNIRLLMMQRAFGVHSASIEHDTLEWRR
jgi:hypothetical protein